ncbi:MAG: DUF3656 domain-containing protein, partial [Limnochordia bacterium]|nr:DUF3656 domain-containing protein [Limnochordia bacterium]
FSARAYAANFDQRQLVEAVDYCHIRGVRLYVTVNTIVADPELEELVDHLRFLHEIGVDALIVQDLAVVELAKEFTRIPLHASTQMTVHNPSDLRVLEELGISRVVLARELSLEEISLLRAASPIEIEIFAHGALCVSYSGQCLFSSLLGGRSGNRGRCAQPCRMRYCLNLPGSKGLAGYLLSTKDLCTLERLGSIVQSGVAALKIEGRMKAPEYVAIVTKVYREALDRAIGDPLGFVAREEERNQLEAAFSRGFTLGHLWGSRGEQLVNYHYPGNRGVHQGQVVKVSQDRVWVKIDKKLIEKEQVQFWGTNNGPRKSTVLDLRQGSRPVKTADAGSIVNWRHRGRVNMGDEVYKRVTDPQAIDTYTSPRCWRTVPVRIKATAMVGQPFTLELWDDDGNYVKQISQGVGQPARTQPLTEEVVSEKLLQLGNVPFRAEECEVIITGEVMVPLGEIKRVRRKAFELLSELRTNHFRRPAIDSSYQIIHPSVRPKEGTNPKLAVYINEKEAIVPLSEAGADLIYFGGERFKGGHNQCQSAVYPLEEYVAARDLAKKQEIELLWAFPRITQRRELAEIVRIVEAAEDDLPQGFLVGNLGTLYALRGKGPLGADFSFNVYNRIALKRMGDLGCARVCLSVELTLSQISTIASGATPTEVIVHGRLPLMVSEYCPGQLLGCQHCLGDGGGALVDRMNFTFPIRTDGSCRMHLFNSKELAALRTIPTLKRVGVSVIRLDLRLHQLPEAITIVRLYREALSADDEGLASIEGELLDMLRGDYTLGHFYRGV